MRILHAPVNVGNQPWVLSRFERALGARSEVAVNYGTWFGYPADRVLGEYGKGGLLRRARRAAFALSSPFRYDVLHYYFGRTLMTWDDIGGSGRLDLADLRLARSLGKRIVFTLQGCDARLAGKSNARNEVTTCKQGHCTAYAQCIASYDAARQRLIDDVLPLADDVFYLNPELGHYVPHARFFPYCAFDVRAHEPVAPHRTRRPRIVHAPSDGSVKGTPQVLRALEQLRESYDFELVLVENKPYAEALALYRDADIAIDQLLSGWYGGLAVELMAMGKPVMCYLRDADFDFLPTGMASDLPLLRTSPQTLAEDLARVLDCRDDWQQWSQQSRQFVLDWHDPVRLARAMLDVYQGADLRLDKDGTSTCAA